MKKKPEIIKKSNFEVLTNLQLLQVRGGDEMPPPPERKR
jgi:hypothetical protein